MLKWLFFDLGSTLLDETPCSEVRIRHFLAQSGAPDRETLLGIMRENAAKGLSPYMDTARQLGLELAKWPRYMEIVYPGVIETLEVLRGRYHLGVIANQPMGTEERMVKYGIRPYFEMILSSAEEGMEKPEPAIFEKALRLAGCNPEEACMIGDRLDNDMAPAQRLGMRTIWVRQGFFAEMDPQAWNCRPDVAVDHIQDIRKHI